MPSIADLIYSQMSQAGKPRTTTQTTDITQTGEGIDWGSLGMLIYMMLNQKNQPQTGTSDFSNFYLRTAAPALPAPSMPALQSIPPQGSFAQLDPIQLMLALSQAGIRR